MAGIPTNLYRTVGKQVVPQKFRCTKFWIPCARACKRAVPPSFSNIRVSLPSLSKSISPKDCCFDGKELVKVTRSHSQGWTSRRRRRRHQSHPRRSRRRRCGHSRRHESRRGDTPTAALVRIDATLEANVQLRRRCTAHNFTKSTGVHKIHGLCFISGGNKDRNSRDRGPG